MTMLQLVERKLQRLGHFFAKIRNDVPGAGMSYETHADHLMSLPLADSACGFVLTLIKCKQQIDIFRGNNIHDGFTTKTWPWIYVMNKSAGKPDSLCFYVA